MKNNSSSGQPGWRAPEPEGEGRAGLGPRWRSQPEGRLRPRRHPWPWGSIFLTFLTFTAFCGLFTWMSFWLRPAKDTSLVLLGASYQENLAVPHNVHGWHTLQALADYAKSISSRAWNGGQLQHYQGPREVKTAHDFWNKELARFPGKTLFLYVALHGGADRKGAYLIPQQAFMDEEETPQNIRLEDLFKKLETLPRNRNVVLLLDATQMTTNWSLGMLNNEFSRELDKLNSRIEEIPNLVVINASGLNQKSWVSEEWRQTVFGHYLLEGLKGAAEDASLDGRIDLLELFRFVKLNVGTWARLNRNAEQTPVLYPREELGRERARQIHVTIADPYSPPTPGVGKPFVAPKELKEAWERYGDLQKQVPGPAVYTPHLWPLYQDWLLRYEQLVLAGGSAALNMQQQLRDRELAMAQAQRQDLTSGRTTLTMMAATGMAPPPGDGATQVVNSLWEAQPKDQVKIWQDIQAKNDGATLANLRLQMSEMLLERAVDDPSAHLDKVYQLLLLLDDPLQVRPAENHFLMMLRRDMPGLGDLPRLLTNGRGKGITIRLVSQNASPGPTVNPDLLRLALRVRLRAERAALGLGEGSWKEGQRGRGRYAYVEQVVPWIQTWVDQGDTARRRGQDLLFAGDPSSWARAEKYFVEADRHYRKAQEEARPIRGALETRDRVLPMLPYYAHWLAERRLSESEKRLNEPVWVPEKFEKLCHNIHDLLDLLVNPVAGTARQVGELAELVGRQFAELEKEAQLAMQGINEVGNPSEGRSLPSEWKCLDDCLLVPMADAKLRVEMLEKKSRMGQSLQLSMDRADKASFAELDQNPSHRESVKDRARWHGRMNLALLGQRWFDESGGDLEDFKQVNHRLQTFSVEEKWWESLMIAGEEIAQRWKRLARETQRLLDATGKSNAEQVGAQLQRADRYTRLLNGLAQLNFGKNAAGRFRDYNLENLLLTQARRTWEDHWFSEDPGKEPYYRLAGKTFLGDARSLMQTGFAEGDKRLEDLEAKLLNKNEMRLELVAAPGMSGKGAKERKATPVNITTEQSFSLQYRLAAPPEVTGLPLVWGEPGPEVRVDNPKPMGRLVQEFQDRPEVLLSYQLHSPFLQEAEKKSPGSAESKESFFAMKGYYRGQFLDLTTPLHLSPWPRSVVAEHLLPVRASVAVRASKEVHQQYGQGNGALVLILDCSGSMGPGQGQSFTKTTKFVEATEALRHMLQKVPKGTQVSLWVFGQAVGDQRTVERAEDTIHPILRPTTWDPDDADLVKNLMDRVSYPALIPWNESPILRTMATARQDLQSVNGFKTMVVITDGMDNRFDKDKEINQGKKDPRAFIRDNFQDVEVNVIGFKVVGQEEENARKQFQVIEELPLPGKYYLVNESRELANTLEKVLRQRLRYWVDKEDNRPVAGFGEIGLDVSTDSTSDQWLPGGLLPGAFKVRVHTNRRLSKSVALNQSDMLLVELVPNRNPGTLPGSLDFERVIYSLADYPWKPAKEKGNWRLAVLQNQLLKEGGLQMLATLEKKNDPLVSTLQQVVPVKTWLEVVPPADVRLPVQQRWHYQPGYPAPAWSLDLPVWPYRQGSKTPVRPTLRAWWSMETPQPNAVLEKGHDFNKPGDLVEKVVRINEEDVVVESVQVEEHLVETEPAQRDQPAKREMKPCLVVRMRHPKDNPVWVRVPGLNTAGSEHRHFSEMGKYTGIFWPVSRDQVALALRRIEIVSLAAFKRDAEQRNCFIELDNLYEPQANDVRPLQPLDLAPREALSPRVLEGDQVPHLLPAPPAVWALPGLLPWAKNAGPDRPIPGMNLPVMLPWLNTPSWLPPFPATEPLPGKSIQEPPDLRPTPLPNPREVPAEDSLNPKAPMPEVPGGERGGFRSPME